MTYIKRIVPQQAFNKHHVGYDATLYRIFTMYLFAILDLPDFSGITE